MASHVSPSCSDDFVMLEEPQIHCLPIRQRHTEHQAEPELCSDLSDDDLEHISRPSSVRSFSISSPVPSPSPVPAREPSPTRVKVPTLCVSADDLHSRPSHHIIQETHQSGATEPNPCNNHAMIDQRIMDMLIEHTLTTNIEQRYGPGDSRDKQIQKEMMSRFRSLPADHVVVKGSVPQVHGSKALFQGQRRTQDELEKIYSHFLDDVGRLALVFVTETHIRTFESACSFFGCGVPADRERMYTIMEQPKAEEARRLAMLIQEKVLESLHTTQTLQNPMNDLRKQTIYRIRVGAHYAGQCELRSNNVVQNSAIRAEFSATTFQLPNMRFDLGDPGFAYDGSYRSPTLKRGLREDEDTGTDALPLPPVKKFRSTQEGWLDSLKTTLHTCRVNHTSGQDRVIAEDQDVDPCPLIKASLFVWAGTRHTFMNTKDVYDCETRARLHHVSRLVMAMYDEDYKSRTGIFAQKARIHGSAPYHLQLMFLEQQNKLRLQLARMEHQNIDQEAARKTVYPEKRFDLFVGDLPILQPTGYLYDNFWLLHRFNSLEKLSRIDEMWISEHARRYAEICSHSQKRKIVDKMLEDGRVNQHCSNYHLDPIEYAFTIDARLLLECAKCTAPHMSTPNDVMVRKQETKKTPPIEPPPCRMSFRTLEVSPQESSPLTFGVQQQLSTEELDSTDEVDSPHTLQYYQMQLMLLEQQNRKKRNVDASARRDPHCKEGGWHRCNYNQESNFHESSAIGKSVVEQEGSPHDCASTTSKDKEIPRKYRHDTLLAASTQLPLSSMKITAGDGGTLRNPQSFAGETLDNIEAQSPLAQVSQDVNGSSKNRVLNVKGQDMKDALSSKDRCEIPPWRLARYHQTPQPQPYPPKDYQKQLRILEQQNKERLKKVLVISQEAKNEARDDKMACATPMSRGTSMTKEQHYQWQLLLLKQQNHHRLTHARINEQNFAIAQQKMNLETKPASMAENFQMPQVIFRVDSGGALWMAFEHESPKGRMEYTIRTDTDSIDVSKLPRELKEAHCIHGTYDEYEKTIQSLTSSASGRVSVRLKQESDMWFDRYRHVMENEMAWALVELNPCLRGEPMESVLKTAVKSLVKYHQEAGDARNQSMRSDSTTVKEEPENNHFEDTSSEEDSDDYEDEEDDDGEEARYCLKKGPEPSLPIALIDARGIPHILFQCGSFGSFAAACYIIRTSNFSVENSSAHQTSTNRDCICDGHTPDPTSPVQHKDRNCWTAIELAQLNPILRGPENRKLREAAFANHEILRSRGRLESSYPTPRHLEQLGHGQVLHQVLTDDLVEDGFIMFRSGPLASDAAMQCVHCNRILEGSSYVARLVHLCTCMP